MITLVGSGCCGLRDMFIFFHAPDLKMFCLTSNIEIHEEVLRYVATPDVQWLFAVVQCVCRTNTRPSFLFMTGRVRSCSYSLPSAKQ